MKALPLCRLELRMLKRLAATGSQVKSCSCRYGGGVHSLVGTVAVGSLTQAW